MADYQKIDLTNASLKYMTVLGYSHTEQYLGAYWNCRCVCGKEVVRLATYLIHRPNVSCGCLKGKIIADQKRLPNHQAVKNSAYKTHLKWADIRGLVSMLSLEDYVAIASRACVYCGGFSTRKNRSTGEEVPLNSVDRRDNDKTYTVATCVPACFICQMMKKDMSYDAFISHVQKLAGYQRSLLT